jgi:F-type H+-transporting ATPase subunit epsilon
MTEKTFHLEIVTPKKVVLSSRVTSFTAPGILGGFQVLRSHAPFLSSIGVGEVKVIDEAGQETRFATSGGFVEVRENKVVIDIQRAEKARNKAQKRLTEKAVEHDLERARVALQRALNRLKVAQKR